MSNESKGGLFSCTNVCWIVGALFALATWLVLARRYEVGTVTAVIVALVVLFALVWLLQKLFCSYVPGERHAGIGGDEPVRVAPEHLKEIDRIEEEALARKPEFNIAEEMRGEDVPSGTERGGAEPEPVPEPAPEPEPAAKPVPAVQEKGSVAKAKKTAAKKPARRPVAPDGKPELLKAPRGGKADDLKMIKGVGTKLEKLLNELGVWHFDQIAGWRKREVQWVDEHLEGFRGRIVRDEWIRQARMLAKGGETEFASRVKKGKVYKG